MLVEVLPVVVLALELLLALGLLRSKAQGTGISLSPVVEGVVDPVVLEVLVDVSDVSVLVPVPVPEVPSPVDPPWLDASSEIMANSTLPEVGFTITSEMVPKFSP